MWLVKIILYPFACLYGGLTHLRNKFFDWHLLCSKRFDLPVISVGNLSAGGSGKTPHVEYLVRLLDAYHIAIVSRGYRRKTKGYLKARPGHKLDELGDESLQYLNKFPGVTIAVDERRRRGIEKALRDDPEIQVILLDDAFQHRYVKPGLSILLTDYHHLYTKDYLMPTGTLREWRSGAKRADIIVVTKTPKIFSPLIRRELIEAISARKYQKLFFSYVAYDTPVPLKITGITTPAAAKPAYIVMVAGVANSYPMQEYLRDFCGELTVIDFDDHHEYEDQDLDKIFKSFDSIISKDKVIFTTEKDAMRFEKEEFSSRLAGKPIYYLPIRVKFHPSEEIKFDDVILNYVAKAGRDH